MTNAIGLQVTQRVRLGAHDAHYAGELVDGARILAFFGDVATELLVRSDGDEGLFRAYESVEFLAPVFAGDFLEVTGVITAMGSTSRRMVFEARKVAGNVRSPDLPPSAAQVLARPVTVCRAVGTCVVPQELQRRPALLAPGLPAPPSTASLGQGVVCVPPPPHTIVTPPPAVPMEVILAATIGALDSAGNPIGGPSALASEIAEEARRCREAGAAVVNLSIPAAQETAAAWRKGLAEIVQAVRAETDVVVQVSTGGAAGTTFEQRLASLACRPEMATLDCGTVNFGDDVLVNSRPQVRQLAARAREAQTVPELQCYEIGNIREAMALAAEGLIASPLRFQFVLGVPGAIGAGEDIIRFMVSQIPSDAIWSVAAVGPLQQATTEAAIRLGGNARIGPAGSFSLDGGSPVQGSASLVANAAVYAHSIGRKVVEPSRARELLLLRGA